FFQAEDGIRDDLVTGVQTCALPILRDFLHQQLRHFRERDIQVVFESDYPPPALGRFIDGFDAAAFGVNYDIGNSASLGFDPREEVATYGHRITNAHGKDRALGGSPVPWGTGAANFDAVFGALANVPYTGNYVLQTARASDGDHAGTLARFRDMTADWIRRHGA